jgi:hypothetical protein
LLEEVYAKQKIKNKDVVIKQLSSINDVKDVHILFIGVSSEDELKEIINVTKNKPVLTISEKKGYAHKGVLINFYLEGNKVRFEINEKAVKESGLIMGFQLLSYAKIINPTNDKR